MNRLHLEPITQITGELKLPGSKSISNRALLLAALADGSTRLENLLDSEDTAYMVEALTQLGVSLERSGERCVVRGCAGPLVRAPVRHELFLGLAGTALRPLTAALTLGRGSFVIDGNERMRERPVADLVDALRQLGASIRYLGADGFPPLEVNGTGLKGGTATIRGDVSSQFLTSLLLAAPLAAGAVHVDVIGEQVSKPYLDITLQMMQQFGAAVSHRAHQHFEVAPGGYRSPGDYLVEGDASSASYFLAAGAIRGDGVTVRGIGRDSVQGDVAFVDVLGQMGARVIKNADSIEIRPGSKPLKAVDVDLNHIPDAAMTLAVLALFANGTTRIRNVGNWRVKETDRLSAMAKELRKVGAEVDEGPDYLSVTPPARPRQDAEIATYGDHRMAMCFSLVALAGVGVTILNPDCVAKTFPDYFQQFQSLAR